MIMTKVDTFWLQVNCMGVDEWLMLCKKLKKLSDRFPDTWAPDEGQSIYAVVTCCCHMLLSHAVVTM